MTTIPKSQPRLETHYGIDFGTTNTRVALLDGDTIRSVAFKAADGRTMSHWPTRLAYRGGKAVAFGADALNEPHEQHFPDPLKWMLDGDQDAVDVPGGTDPRLRTDVIADYLRNVKAQIARQRLPALESAAVTIPVKYPHRARTALREAFDQARAPVAGQSPLL